jgi:hypothetical protein
MALGKEHFCLNMYMGNGPCLLIKLAVEKILEWLILSRQTVKDIAIKLHINPVARSR